MKEKKIEEMEERKGEKKEENEIISPPQVTDRLEVILLERSTVCPPIG